MHLIAGNEVRLSFEAKSTSPDETKSPINSVVISRFHEEREYAGEYLQICRENVQTIEQATEILNDKRRKLLGKIHKKKQIAIDDIHKAVSSCTNDVNVFVDANQKMLEKLKGDTEKYIHDVTTQLQNLEQQTQHEPGLSITKQLNKLYESITPCFAIKVGGIKMGLPPGNWLDLKSLSNLELENFAIDKREIAIRETYVNMTRATCNTLDMPGSVALDSCKPTGPDQVMSDTYVVLDNPPPKRPERTCIVKPIEKASRKPPPQLPKTDDNDDVIDEYGGYTIPNTPMMNPTSHDENDYENLQHAQSAVQLAAQPSTTPGLKPMPLRVQSMPLGDQPATSGVQTTPLGGQSTSLATQSSLSGAQSPMLVAQSPSQVPQHRPLSHQSVQLGGRPTALRLIYGNIWACLEDGKIKVFSRQLRPLIFNIPQVEWNAVYDITCIWPKHFVICTNNGLFYLVHDLEKVLKLKRIAKGCFTSSVFSAKNEVLFAAQSELNDDSMVVSYKHGQRWKLLKDVTHKSKAFTTLGLSGDKLYVCSTTYDRIDVLSIPDKLRHLTMLGSRGSGGPGLLYAPRLCAADNETVLIADTGHHQLQTVTVGREHRWQILDLQATVKTPISAVRFGNQLFVTSASDYTLSVHNLD